jgi:hypothetical protein
MNTENSNFYLKHGKLIAIAGFLSVFIATFSIYFQYTVGSESSSTIIPTSLKIKFIWFLLSGLFWFVIGKILGSYKNAMVCLGVSATLYTINHFFENGLNFFFENSVVIDFFNKTGFIIIPYFIFGLIEFKKYKAALIMLFVGLANLILWAKVDVSTLLFQGINGLFRSSDWFIINVKSNAYEGSFIPFNVFSEFSYLFRFVFQIVLFFELYKYCNNGFQKIKINIFNLQNEYSKLIMTILFFTFKWTILRIAIAIPEFFSESSLYRTSQISLTYQYVQLTCSILTFIFCIYFLRKILVEFYISYGRPPSWLYWLCLIPVFDYIIWLVVIFSFERKINQSERLNLFETENDNMALVIFMILVQLFSIFRGFADNDFSSSIVKFFVTLSITNTFFLFFAYKNLAFLRFIFWSMIATSIVALGLALKPIEGIYSEVTLIILGSSLFSIAVIVHFFPIFHLQEFLYIGGEDDEIAKENIE